MKKTLSLMLLTAMLCTMLTACDCKHKETDWETTKEATCTTEGLRKEFCKKCKETLQTETVKKRTTHTSGTPVQENIVNATATQMGSFDEVFYCTVCHTEISRTKKDLPIGSIISPDSGNNEGNSSGEGAPEKTPTEGVIYELSDDSTYAIVSGYEGASTDVIIASTYQGVPVTEIGYRAFKDRTQLASIHIPDSVTCINTSAFQNCTALTSINIPSSVTNIQYWAFEGCDNLAYNTYDNAYYLGNAENPYYVLMEGINKNITSCKIHVDTKVIAGRAFYAHKSLSSITIPNSVMSICYQAFDICEGLTSIHIPNSVQILDSWAFGACSSLKAVTFEESSQLSIIGWAAFCSCKSLTSINIPDSVTNIGMDAFFECTSLTSIHIPKNVQAIGDSAFSDCSTLQTVTFQEGSHLVSIGYGVFNNCVKLSSITIPASVTSIGDYAFSWCIKLTSLAFADPTDWYRTNNYEGWENKTGGTQTSLSDTSTNVDYFISAYIDSYWYKK
ncbi:MAG: leucine-rich repeat domain-containing protein [Clostridia bacterium]|nr:leucine-rich repeat domain-containing protein [Clostridia bacterium]